MAVPREYRSFQDFERDNLRRDMRIGWCVDELEEPERDDVDFDMDPFEAALWKAEQDEDEEED